MNQTATSYILGYLFFFMCICHAQPINSIRISYINSFDNTDPATNQPFFIPNAFLERSRLNGYTHILVEYYLFDETCWTNGRYTGNSQPAGSSAAYASGGLYDMLKNHITLVRSYGLEYIPMIHVPGTSPGTTSVFSWYAPIHSNNNIELYQNPQSGWPNYNPCIASGLSIPTAGGGTTILNNHFQVAFVDFMKVLEAACDANGYTLPYVNIGYSECLADATTPSPIFGTVRSDGGNSIDQTWMTATGQDVVELVIASVSQRLNDLRSANGRLSNTKILLFGDMFSREFRRALHNTTVGDAFSTLGFPSRPSAQILINDVIIMPWWYEKNWVLSPSIDFNTESEFKQFTDFGFKIIYMRCITDDNLTWTLPSRIPELIESINTAKSLQTNIIGFASAHWDGNGYDSDLCWNTMEFMAYGNQTARPPIDKRIIPKGMFNGLPIPRLLMDATEVTQGDYYAITGKFPFYNSFSGNLMLPAEYVTYYDAILYCNARSKNEGLDTIYSYSSKIINGTTNRCTSMADLTPHRDKKGYFLPTSVEWQYAYLAGASSGPYWGSNPTVNYAWCSENSTGQTHPVKNKLPNAFGLYDMSGNVVEMTEDDHCWGGSFIHAASSSYLYSSFDVQRDVVMTLMGFRVARLAPPDMTPIFNLLLDDSPTTP